MWQKHKCSSVVPGLLVVALLAACTQDAMNPDRSAAGKPSFKKETGGGCPVKKFTGGGRIDPTNPNTNADFEDGASGFAALTGKVTFGFNVFLDNQCNVMKSEIQVVHHPSKTRWHVSVHGGVSDFGETVQATTFPSLSGRGWCIIVGPVTARVNGQQGQELVAMEACDNGEPGSQRPGLSSVGPDSFKWATQGHGDTDLTYLTGGNIQAH